MRCHEARHFLYAFADGELDVKDNLEVLAHLNMCPACAERVNVEHRLRERLRTIFGQEQAPPWLADRVRARIGTHRTRAGSLAIRLGPALLAAAALALVAWVWMQARPDAEVLAGPDMLDNPSRPVRAADLAACFERGHQKCAAVGPSHHLAGLSRDLPTLEAELSSDLGIPVLAPDWREEQLRFMSACRCGVPGGLRGAHLVYDKLTHVQRVSLYSLHPGGPFDRFSPAVIKEKPYLVAHAEEMSLIAWRGPEADYVLCVPGPHGQDAELVVRLIDPLRVALSQWGPLGGEALAAATGGRGWAALRESPFAPVLAVIPLGNQWPTRRPDR